METKKILGFIGIFALVILSLNLIAAADSDVTFNPADLTITGKQGETVTTTFTISNDHPGTLTDLSFNFSDLTIDSKTITKTNLNTDLTPDSEIAGEGELIVTLNITIPSNQEIGIYTGTADFIATLSSELNINRGKIPITLTVKAKPSQTLNFCEYENPGQLTLNIEDINVESGFGNDDEYWYLFDNIEVELSVENKGDWDIDNIEVRWGLYNDVLEDFIIDEKENDFNLDYDDDEEILTITFKLDKKIKKYNDGDTTLYVWATGTIEDNDAGAFDNQDTCVQDSYETNIKTGDKFVILDEITFPEIVSCNEKMTVSFNVQNIGDKKQDDIFVAISNPELGISKIIEIGTVDDFDKEEISTLIQIPAGAEEKLYDLEFNVLDDDGEIFENDEGDKAKFLIPFNIEGDCQATTSEPIITATLDSEAKVGQELIIKVSVTNKGKNASFITIAAGYDLWAELINIEPSVVTINEGETKQIILKLKPTQAGAQTFKVQIVYEGQTKEQEVSVNIAEKTSGLTGAFAGIGDAGLYIIAVIFLILIIVIITLIIKVSSGPKAEEF